MKPISIPSAAQTKQQGVILIVVLILVAIMVLVGSFAIRNSQQSERTVNGLRNAQVARDAAETGLRFCEQVALAEWSGNDYKNPSTSTTISKDKVSSPATLITSEDDPTAIWSKADSWKSTSKFLIEVPAWFYQKTTEKGGTTIDTSVPNLTNAPMCVIEKLQNNKINGYVITARGLANNALLEKSTGKVTQGAEAWVQSVLLSQ